MKKRKTELDFHSLEYSQSHRHSDEDVEDISLKVTETKLSRSISSRDIFLRKRSSILHDLVLSLGFSTRTESVGRPWKVCVQPWSK